MRFSPGAVTRPSWRAAAAADAAGDGYEAISHEDFVFALTQMDSFIDVSEEDLLRIYSLATGRHREALAAAACYRQPFCAFLKLAKSPFW
jgi:CBS-domain-containing membrane protein